MLRGSLQNDDANGFLSLAKRISLAIITGSDKDVPLLFRDAAGHARTRRRWPHIAAEFRRLRRPEDAFIYEVVPVGSLEDTICAAVLNPNIAAVAIYEGFALRSRHDASILRSVLAAQQPFLDKADMAVIQKSNGQGRDAKVSRKAIDRSEARLGSSQVHPVVR